MDASDLIWGIPIVINDVAPKDTAYAVGPGWTGGRYEVWCHDEEDRTRLIARIKGVGAGGLAVPRSEPKPVPETPPTPMESVGGERGEDLRRPRMAPYAYWSGLVRHLPSPL